MNDTRDKANDREPNSEANRRDDSGAAVQSERDEETTGDPGRTPGKAEGVEDPEEQGNE